MLICKTSLPETFPHMEENATENLLPTVYVLFMRNKTSFFAFKGQKTVTSYKLPSFCGFLE